MRKPEIFKSLRRRRGATATEYMVLLLLVGLTVVAIIRVFGGTISEKVDAANSEIEYATESEEERRRRLAEQRYDKEFKGDRASASNRPGDDQASGGGGGSSSDDGADGAVVDAPEGPDNQATHIGGLGEAAEEEGGFNPVVLILALLLGGLLVYVMFGGQKDG